MKMRKLCNCMPHTGHCRGVVGAWVDGGHPGGIRVSAHAVPQDAQHGAQGPGGAGADAGHATPLGRDARLARQGRAAGGRLPAAD